MSRGVELYENFYAKRDIREHATVGKIIVFDWGEGNNFWFELSGGLKNPGCEKLGFYCPYDTSI